MSDVQGRVRVQRVAYKGEIVEVKTTINHPMDTGTRKNKEGNTIPRRFITHFKCQYNDKEVFRAEWSPSVSANPFLSFFVTAIESGNIHFEWVEDTGRVFKKSAEIIVES